MKYLKNTDKYAMNFYFWTLCILFLFLRQLSAEAFQPIVSDLGFSSEQDQGGTQFFVPPSTAETLTALPVPSSFGDSSNPGVDSVIDLVMGSGANTPSVSEDFFKTSASTALEVEPEPVYDVAPVKEWTIEDITGTKEDSVEDVLSSRGLPRVNSASTSLDILGLPKPDTTEYEALPKTVETIEEGQSDKAKKKAHFSDMFK